MSRFTKESIQRLREAIDIVDLISRYLPLKRAGTTFKGLCPFHDEKTPSFTVNKASRHYHCFGCGAHGDAVAFLMQHERMEFKQALEFLSERFGVPLESDSGENDERGKSKARLRQVNEAASTFYHTFLLHSEEAKGAREYLAKRGFPLSFLQAFLIGYAPSVSGVLRKFLHTSGFSDDEMEQAGLLVRHEGRVREFFSERITFPILDAIGHTLGFSARKWREETYGGKYVNTQETALFKKSKVLFGLFYSKKRMMKDRIACLVEGQVDALRLIEAGFDFTVASLGTAFGLPHVEQLKAMGIEEVYLSFDQDEAGLSSAEKAGQLMMKKGIGVKVVQFSDAKDPDELLEKKGKAAFFQALTSAVDFLLFLISRAKATQNWASPREKDKAVRGIADKIREWENPILVYESLKQLSSLAQVPESLLNIGNEPAAPMVDKSFLVEHRPEGGSSDLIVELDLVRWLVFAGPDNQDLVHGCLQHLNAEDFIHDVPRQLFCLTIERLRKGERPDFMGFAGEVDIESVSDAFKTLVSRHQRIEKAGSIASECVKKIKERNWMKKRESIRKQMEDPALTEQDLIQLARTFDELSKSPPSVPSFAK
jgi:DNA primase